MFNGIEVSVMPCPKCGKELKYSELSTDTWCKPCGTFWEVKREASEGADVGRGGRDSDTPVRGRGSSASAEGKAKLRDQALGGRGGVLSEVLGTKRRTVGGMRFRCINNLKLQGTKKTMTVIVKEEE